MASARWLLLLALWPTAAHAGLHYSGETYANLPSQWSGFLIDHRNLRQAAAPSAKDVPDSPFRARYLAEAQRLEKQQPKLNADDLADLGALYVRLGQSDKAVALLVPAQRAHPNHFRIAANLGTAWQLQGELAQAVACLEQAVRLAPGKHLAAEELHLKLVRGRLKNGPRFVELDDLFGVAYRGPKGGYEPGLLDEKERKKLPSRAVAQVQQLALWLPGDGLLLWQLAELAAAHGDVRTAAAMMDGGLTQFGLTSPTLRRHRQEMRAAADRLAKPMIGDKKDHDPRHAGILAFASRRPLLSRADLAPLPPISADGVNDLPWEVIGETSVDNRARPTFPQYLRELDGKLVKLVGFMQPLRDDQEQNAFLFLEYPVGCWYCELPPTTGILFVELPEGMSAAFTRNMIAVTGRLRLNAANPEDFLFKLGEAKIGTVN